MVLFHGYHMATQDLSKYGNIFRDVVDFGEVYAYYIMVDCNREQTIRCKIHMTEEITLW